MLCGPLALLLALARGIQIAAGVLNSIKTVRRWWRQHRHTSEHPCLRAPHKGAR
jgi:hypothetical protein